MIPSDRMACQSYLSLHVIRDGKEAVNFSSLNNNFMRKNSENCHNLISFYNHFSPEKNMQSPFLVKVGILICGLF